MYMKWPRTTHVHPMSTPRLAHGQCDTGQPQTLFFKAATGYALTIVFAGFALTVVISPKIIFLQALVAGFCLLLIVRSFGSVNLPTDFTSLVAIWARTLMTFAVTLVLSSCCSAMALAMPVLVIGLGPPM